MTRLAVFDCDGTLVDSGHTIFVAMQQALTDHGLDCPPPELCRQMIGLSLVEAIAQLVPSISLERHQAIAETYKQRFHQLRLAGLVSEPLFDGILDLLQQLEDEGWLLAVATGKSDRGLRHCLESHGIHARFVSLQTADRHPSKPHPSMVLTAIAEAGAEPGATVVVGDTSFDMRMARAAGANGIGAAWGYHSRDELASAGAAAVANSPPEVALISRQLIGHHHG